MFLLRVCNLVVVRNVDDLFIRECIENFVHKCIF